jgi:N,N-dimethylformamidase
MSKTNRRAFLKRTGAGAAGLAAWQWSTLAGLAAPDSAIPPHQPLDLTGVHAYPAQHSVFAGGKLALHVSASVPYRLAVCKLGETIDDPSGDPELFSLDIPHPVLRPLHPGSYVHIEKRLRGMLHAITLECWVRPWDISKLQGLISQEDKDSEEGFALGIGKDGYVGFFLGDGFSPDDAVVHRTKPGAVKRGQWHHVVATWDGRRKRVYVDAKEVGAWDFSNPLLPGKHALRLGAMAQAGITRSFLDGDLAAPAIYERALGAEEIRERFEQKGLRPARGKGVLACWPLAEERGDRVADASGDSRHGRIINHATWMIGGPGFNAEVVRFDRYDPKADSKRGHGLRLASDDLYDCRWPVTHEFRIPPDAKSGFYVARFRFEMDGKPRLYDVTFIVRKAVRRRKAPILLVAATNTWRAYSGTHFAPTPPELKQVWSTRGIKNAPNNPPAFNLYSAHAAGQGTYQVGLRMPWPAASPYVLYGGPTDYSHLMRADRFAQVWLEQAGYEYDVISDLDLHREPGLLRGYRVFVINGHNEYWSQPMYNALEDYLQRGGNVICLSGNTLFWRVSFNEDATVMECRKVDAPGEQVPAIRRGECWHSQDGRRGGMMRECGLPGWRLIGLDTLGWNNQGLAANYGPYIVDDPEHFLFNQPEKLGLKRGDKFGHAGEGKLPMANGHEIDVRLSTLAALQEEPNPKGATMPSDPPGIVRIANGVIPWSKGGSAFDFFFRKLKPKTEQGGELIYWERPEGGRVFNAGSIGSGWALHADPKFQGLMRNVLAHFGVSRAGAF